MKKKIVIIAIGLVLFCVLSFYPPIAEKVNQWIASAGLLGMIVLAVLGNHFSDLFKSSPQESPIQKKTAAPIRDAISHHRDFYSKCYGRDELAKNVFNQLNNANGCTVREVLASAGMGKSVFLSKCASYFDSEKSAGDLLFFYPFRFSDPVLNKPRNLYLHLLVQLAKNITPENEWDSLEEKITKERESDSVVELKKYLLTKLNEWKEKNKDKKIFILVDAIEEADTPSEIPKEKNHHPMPILFEDGAEHLSHCRLLFTVRGKWSGNEPNPVSGQVVRDWVNSTKKELVIKLDAIDAGALGEWVFAELPSNLTQTEKEQLKDAILNKTKDTDHYPLYIHHILQEIGDNRPKNWDYAEINQFVQKLPDSLVKYAEQKLRQMKRGRNREMIFLLSCAKNGVSQSALGIRDNALSSDIARWVMLSAGSGGNAEFQHDLYQKWFREHIQSLPPWWCPVWIEWKWNKEKWKLDEFTISASIAWKCRAKLPPSLSLSRLWAKRCWPAWMNSLRVHVLGTPYAKSHLWLEKLCLKNPESEFGMKHLIYHATECGDWWTVHDKLTDLDYIQQRGAAGQVYELLEDYNHALDGWPDYERYSPYKEYHVPKWEQTLILSRLKEWKDWSYTAYAKEDKWPDHGSHAETCLRMRFAELCSEKQVDPFAEKMEELSAGRVELFYQFVRECASAIAHAKECAFAIDDAKECSTVVVEQALRRAKQGIVAQKAEAISKVWDKEKKPYLRYAEGSRPEKVPTRPAFLFDLVGHTGHVTHIAMTPDGKRAVSASHDTTLKVWDLESGECLHTLKGHSEGVNHVAMTPDGKRAVSASDDVTLKVWDLESGQCLHTLKGHSEGVNHVAVTPDGRQAISASANKSEAYFAGGNHTLKVWDMKSYQCLYTLDRHADHVWHGIVMDGKGAVSAQGRGTIKEWDLEGDDYARKYHDHTRRECNLMVWDFESGKCLHTLVGHSGDINRVVVMPDGMRVISVGSDATLKVWNLEAGECLHTLRGHSEEVLEVAVTSDGTRAISAASDATLKVWNLESGECLHTLEGDRNVYKLYPVVTLDGMRAVSVGSGATLKVWDLESGKALHNTFTGHSSEVDMVVVSPDCKRLVSAECKGTLKVWDGDGGQCLHSLEEYPRSIRQVVVTSDNKRAVLLGEMDDALAVWDLDASKSVRTFLKHPQQVDQFVVTPDAKRAVSSSWDGASMSFDGCLKVWDLENGNCLHTLTGHSGLVRLVKVTPDSKRVVSAGDDKTLKVWDLASGECLHSLEGHSGKVNHVAITPDGKRAISQGAMEDTLKVWNLESGACLHTLVGHSDVWQVAVTPDGKRAVSTGVKGTRRVWDLERGKCIYVLRERSGWTGQVAVTPEGQQAISVCKTGNLKVWGLEKGKDIHILKGHKGSVWLVVTQDGRWAVSASDDNTLKVWNLKDGTLRATRYADDVMVLRWTTQGTLIVGQIKGFALQFAHIDFGDEANPWLATPVKKADGSIVFYCPHCGSEEVVPPTVVNCVEELKRQHPTPYEFGHSPCLELPSEAWDTLGLLRDEAGKAFVCSHCQNRIRFNPWIVGELSPDKGHTERLWRAIWAEIGEEPIYE